MAPPRYLVRICRGRMCAAFGADAVLDAAALALRARRDDERARVVLSRGGCYGLCEIGPNVVVRRYPDDVPLPPLDVDSLTLTGRDGEVVYCAIQPDEASAIVAGHLDDDAPVAALTRAVREAAIPPASGVAARIRALRAKRGDP